MSSRKRKKKKKKNAFRNFVVMSIPVLALAVLVLAFLAFLESRHITINVRGEREMTLEVGSADYVDAGAEAYFGSKAFSFGRQKLVVAPTGTVDTSVPGDYTIVYKATYKGDSKTVRRVVHVKDTKAPVITLNTVDGYYTPYDHEYEEEGYTAYDEYEGDVTAKVKVEKKDDKTLLYTVTDAAGNESTVERVIPFDDRQGPEITLEGGEEYVIDLRDTYKEPGFKAVDDCSGDVTASVVVTSAPGNKENETIYTYTATDGYNNVTTVTRTVIKKDLDLPEIVLKGEPQMILTGGYWYKEPGFEAHDRQDGDLTESVKVEGEVEYFHVGTYTLTYRVKDADGNEATTTRTVVVEGRDQPEPVSMGPKAVYLTFDDGPSQYTQKLLDVLAKYDVKATFFVTANHKECRDMILAEHAAGHTVAIHTFTHDYKTIYASEMAYFNDLNKMSERIEELIGIRPSIIRFPGGSSNTVSKKYCAGVMTKLTEDMNVMGFQYYDWNVLSGDADKEGPILTEQVYKNVINGIAYNSKNGRSSIVLQHDVKEFSVNAVEDIIKWCLDNGYTFYAIEPTTPTVHQKVAN